MYGDGLSEQHIGAVLSELGAGTGSSSAPRYACASSSCDDPPARCATPWSRACSASAATPSTCCSCTTPSAAPSTRPARSVGDVAARRDRGGDARAGREGLTRHIGFTGVGETEALHENARSGRFETMQSYFNAINPSAGHAGKSGPGQDMAGVIDVAAQAGLGVIAIRVMAGGAMTGQEARAALASPGLGPALVPGDTYEADIARGVNSARWHASSGSSRRWS